MQQTLERAAAQSQGSRVAPKTGLQTCEMRAWRGLGRAMTDIIMRFYMIILGRTDFRMHILSSYALEVQSSLSVASTKQVLDCGERMFTAIGVLVERRGSTNWLQAMCSGLLLTEGDVEQSFTNRSRCTETISCMPTNTSLWMTCNRKRSWHTVAGACAPYCLEG
jgi:hypothetical protein